MTPDTLVTIGVSALTSAITTFATIAFAVGRYVEKVDQLERCDLQRRVSTLEGQYTAATITQHKSPLSLNDRGLKLLDDSGARKFVDDNLTDLIAKIHAIGAPTAYDVQEKAGQVVRSYRDDVCFVPLKEFAFQQGIDLDMIELAAGLYLRDRTLPRLGFMIGGKMRGWEHADA